MNPKKILIVQLRRVGDVIFTLPVITVLRRQFPSAQIDFLVEKPSDQMVRLHPGLSECLVYEKEHPIRWIKKIREKAYDWVLDFHSNGRTLFLAFFSGAGVRAGFKGPLSRSLVYNHCAATTDKKYLPEQKMDILKALGVRCESWSWDLELPRAEMDWANHYLKSQGIQPNAQVVGLAPATRRPIRAWREERFAEVAQNVLNESKPVLFLSGPGEAPMVERICRMIRRPQNSLGRVLIPPETPLIKLAALIKRCSVVLAVDNGPKNMAVALGVPTLTLSGPTNPLSFNPREDPLHPVLRDEKLFCISCGLNACPYQHECMDHLSVETVVHHLKKLCSAAVVKKAAVA